MARAKQPDERPLFGIAAVAAFVVMCLVSVAFINWFGEFEPDLEFYELVVIGLGCLRLIHLITYDKILEPLRERLEVGSRNGLMRLMADFVNCIWCTGMWSAVIVVTIYMLGQWGRFTVLIFAVAGLGALLQVISRAIAGCAVEPKK